MNRRKYSNQVIDTVREQSDLVGIVSEYLSLKKSGQNYTGLCPFHEEKTPSFVVSPLKKLFHCFGCGEGGDLFQFLTKIEGIPFRESLERLAEKAGVRLPEEHAFQQGNQDPSNTDKIYEINEAVATYFHDNLLKSPEGEKARAYLHKRGLTNESIKKFKIGYALPSWNHLIKTFEKRYPLALLDKSGLVSRKQIESTHVDQKYFDRFRDRIIFPIWSSRGQVLGFGGRVQNDAQPKYLNSPETAIFKKGKQLYGLNHAKGKGIHPMIVVEGYLDLITSQQAGIPNIVATLGTALTKDHLQLIRRFSNEIILIFDSDKAGVQAALRAAPLLLSEGISAKIVTLSAGKDPDLLIRKKGKDVFLHEIKQGKAVIDFAITQFIKEVPIRSINDKMKVIHKTFPLINQLNSQIGQSHYLKTLSEILAVRETDLRSEYTKYLKQRKAGSIQQPSISPLRKKETLPQDQEGILSLLLQDLLDPTELNGKLDLEDFTNASAKEIVSHYWNPQEAQWQRPSHTIEISDAHSVALLSRLSLIKIDSDKIRQVEEDYIRKLRLKRLDREKRQIDMQLKQSGGEENPEFLKRILDLKKASSHLSLSH